MATIYYTGCSLDGFIATSEHSLDWLIGHAIDPSAAMGFDTFAPGVGAAIMGASTWAWLMEHDPTGWDDTPAWVLTHRSFPAYSTGGPVHFTDAPLTEVHASATQAAGGRDVWVVGGGEVAGQLADHGLLDEVWIQLAPEVLGSGAPVLPRRLTLDLVEVARNGDFVCTRYTVRS